jgi:hypothetical protein
MDQRRDETISVFRFCNKLSFFSWNGLDVVASSFVRSRLVSPSVHTVVHVPVEDSAATAAPASSGGTPG